LLLLGLTPCVYLLKRWWDATNQRSLGEQEAGAGHQ